MLRARAPVGQGLGGPWLLDGHEAFPLQALEHRERRRQQFTLLAVVPTPTCDRRLDGGDQELGRRPAITRLDCHTRSLTCFSTANGELDRSSPIVSDPGSCVLFNSGCRPLLQTRHAATILPATVLPPACNVSGDQRCRTGDGLAPHQWQDTAAPV